MDDVDFPLSNADPLQTSRQDTNQTRITNRNLRKHDFIRSAKARNGTGNNPAWPASRPPRMHFSSYCFFASLSLPFSSSLLDQAIANNASFRADLCPTGRSIWNYQTPTRRYGQMNGQVRCGRQKRKAIVSPGRIQFVLSLSGVKPGSRSWRESQYLRCLYVATLYGV